MDAKEYKRQWYYKNREKCLAYRREWRKKNRELDRESSKAWYRKHRAQELARRREWALKNKERVKLRYLLRLYNIGLDEYEQLFAKQLGVCAVCGNEPSKEALCVDHDHTTGEIRGLLCRKCNTLLGMANEQIKVLESAIRYLKNPPARCINQTCVVDSSSTVRAGGKEK
jgi:hypothetical protein